MTSKSKSIATALTLVLSLAWGTSALASCDEIDPLLLLPESETCPGWIREGDPATAYTLEELTEIIDGGAYLFDSYGFVAAAFQNYAGEVAGQPSQMTLAIYNQGSVDNAEALYNDPNSGSGEPVDDWTGSGEARFQVAFGIVTFEYWEECFFVSIIVTTGGEDAVPHARCMAEQVMVDIQGNTSTRLPSWGDIKALFQ